MSQTRGKASRLPKEVYKSNFPTYGDAEEGESRKKEQIYIYIYIYIIKVRKKAKKVVKHCVFQMFCGSGWSGCGATWWDPTKKCTQLWRKLRSQHECSKEVKKSNFPTHGQMQQQW